MKRRKDYLEFKDEASLKAMLAELKLKNDSELNTWENSISFVSMRNFYQQALEAEAAYQAELLEENKAVTTYNYSPFVRKNKQYFIFEEDNAISLKCFHPEMALVTNKDGIVKICGHFFQYTDNAFKMLQEGRESKLNLLKKATKNDPANKIIVQKIENQNTTTNKVITGSSSAEDKLTAAEVNGAPYIGGKQRAELNLSIYTDYEYDYDNPVEYCDVDQFEVPYCSYYYPVTAVIPKSLLRAKYITRRQTGLLFWVDYKTDEKYIYPTIKLNGNLVIPFYIWASYNLATLDQVVYDGPRGDIKVIMGCESKHYTNSSGNIYFGMNVYLDVP